MAEIKLKGYLCERCGHVWRPDNDDVESRICPHCKSPYWNVPKKKKKEVKK